MFLFILRGDQRRAAIELTYDLEDRLFSHLGRRSRREKPPLPEVGRGEQLLRDQRIGGFLHPVVNEPVGARQTLDQLKSDRFRQSRVELIRRGPQHVRERRDVGDVAETGQLLQRLLGFLRQAGELPGHEVHDIVGIALGVDAIEIPRPPRLPVIKREQSLICKRIKKLKREERIAGCLVVYEPRQRHGVLKFATKRICSQAPQVFAQQGTRA